MTAKFSIYFPIETDQKWPHFLLGWAQKSPLGKKDLISAMIMNFIVRECTWWHLVSDISWMYWKTSALQLATSWWWGVNIISWALELGRLGGFLLLWLYILDSLCQGGLCVFEVHCHPKIFLCMNYPYSSFHLSGWEGVGIPQLLLGMEGSGNASHWDAEWIFLIC